MYRRRRSPPSAPNRASYPAASSGYSIERLHGRQIDREAIYWEHEGNRAVRIGKWKLVAKGARGAWELYDLDADRAEMHDLAANQPHRVQELAAKWQAFAERANVLPLNPQPPAK